MKNITRNDEMIGTPYAIPPEQIEGNSVTAQGDLFSLGAAMFHAVSGAQPFEGPSIAAIFENILKKEPLSLAELDTAAVPEFEEILRKCMAKNPKDRFESAEALDASLRKCLYQYRAINDRSEIEKYLVSPKEYIRQQRGTRIAEKMEEAEKLIAENKVFEALAVYREVLAMDPDNPKVEARISELSRRIPARQGTSVMGRAEKPDNARFHLTWIAFTTALILLSVTGVFILRGKSHSALKSGGPIITVQNTTPPVVAPIPLPEKKAADPAVSPVPLHRATRTKTAAMPETPAPAAPPQAALPVLPEPVKKDTCKGSLAFSSDVWADLYIDNVKSGRVPTKAPLVVACGSHELRLENNLGKQYFTKVIVEADKPLHLSVEKKAFE
jgi:hypothetical protein